jgi:predicted TPR repeat methyltransferase
MGARPLNRSDDACRFSADVFIYVGKLDQVAAQVRRLLRTDGLFAFSAEAEESLAATMDGGSAGYRLSATGRYVHGTAYLDRLAAQNNFKVRCMMKSPLRLENSRYVPGWLVIWQMNGAGRLPEGL